ncbi:MAG: hypothetical protein U5M23_00230 [Marinagarivorans sp.]|nr:hypothetical protein [Marinagarivorans sp.]
MKPDTTVDKFVRHYIQQGIITPAQLAALTGMARSSEDKRCLAVLSDAIASGIVVYQF